MTIHNNTLTDTLGQIKFSQAPAQGAGATPLLCARWGSLALLACALTACAPSHNWREVRHEGVPGSALFPCKPERAVRDVAMLGPGSPAAALHMMSCEVQGRTFAWAAWPLPGPDQGPEVMRAWQQASWASLGQSLAPEAQAPAGWSAKPVAPAGAVAAMRWHGPATNHKGQAIEAQWLMLHTAGWAMQWAVYGPAASPELLEPFWTEVKLPPVGQP